MDNTSDTDTTQTVARWGYKIDELDQLDDWSSEWELVKKNGGFFAKFQYLNLQYNMLTYIYIRYLGR
jgi:hypothetical protein